MKGALPLDPEFLEWHRPRLEGLIRHFEQTGALHSTLLFTGVEGVGKKSLVRYFLQTLFCDETIFAAATAEAEGPGLFGDAPEPQQKKGHWPCGSCKSCKQTLEGQWLDCTWLAPESSEDGERLGVHKIDPFRAIKGKLGLGPAQEPFRAVVIADADRMTLAAANSILKALEEPPNDWIFFLTASDSSRLLPTILSRCMEIRLNPLPPDKIFSLLKTSRGTEFQSTRAKVAARSANGSIARALGLLGDETWELRDQILGLLSSPAHEWFRLVETLHKSQANTHLALDLLESIFSDLLQHQIRGPDHTWTHEDQKELLLQVAEVRNLTPERICRILESLAEKRRWVELTLNGRILAQEILIPVLEVL